MKFYMVAIKGTPLESGKVYFTPGQASRAMKVNSAYRWAYREGKAEIIEFEAYETMRSPNLETFKRQKKVQLMEQEVLGD